MTDQETSQTFEEAIKEHLIANRDTLVQQAVSSAISKLADSMRYTAMSAAQKQLDEFFSNEVGPKVKEWLDTNRENLIAQVVGTMKTVLDVGLKKQAEEWLKAMDSEYSRPTTIAKMFGGKGGY